MTGVAATQREPGTGRADRRVIGGSAGIGLETARRARAEGAGAVLAGRKPERYGAPGQLQVPLTSRPGRGT